MHKKVKNKKTRRINPLLLQRQSHFSSKNKEDYMIIKFYLPGKLRITLGKNNKITELGNEVHYIGGSDVLPPPLETEEENEVIRQLVDESDIAAMSRAKALLIEHNLRLVVYIAKKFDNTGVGVEDLISIGTIGLIKAIGTFNPNKNIKLATYASRCIENEILMYLRRNSKTKLEVSIDEPLNVDWDGNELLLSDILGTDEDVIYKDIESEVERKQLKTAISRLGQREQTIIRLRFGLNSPGDEEMTQKEVADYLGISQSYISRLEKKIMKRLRKELAS
jgi:RNA polymerase sporulation-specific sigma factor